MVCRRRQTDRRTNIIQIICGILHLCLTYCSAIVRRTTNSYFWCVFFQLFVCLHFISIVVIFVVPINNLPFYLHKFTFCIVRHSNLQNIQFLCIACVCVTELSIFCILLVQCYGGTTICVLSTCCALSRIVTH